MDSRTRWNFTPNASFLNRFQFVLSNNFTRRFFRADLAFHTLQGENCSMKLLIFLFMWHSVLLWAETNQPEVVCSDVCKKEVNALVNKHREDVRKCWDSAREEKKELRTDVYKIGVHFKISTEGAVKDASIIKSTTNYPPLDECVLKTLKKFVFAPQASLVDVPEYPFYFGRYAPKK